jgi:hypothetical protein
MPYVPNRERAVVEDKKVQEYLLSEEHPEGRAKAAFFKAIGLANVELLKSTLLEHIRKQPWKAILTTKHGIKYVVEGTIKTPKGTTASIRTIWLIEPNTKAPRLITAYPV